MSDSTPPDLSPSQPLSPAELRAFFAEQRELIHAMAEFRRMFQIYRVTVERYFASRNLTLLQYATLLCLCARQNETPFSVGELAEHFNLQHPACVQLINRMEARDLVARVEEGNIARVIATEAGMRLVHQLIMSTYPAPPMNLRFQLMTAMMESSRCEELFYTARGVEYPHLPPIVLLDRDSSTSS